MTKKTEPIQVPNLHHFSALPPGTPIDFRAASGKWHPGKIAAVSLLWRENGTTVLKYILKNAKGRSIGDFSAASIRLRRSTDDRVDQPAKAPPHRNPGHTSRRRSG